MVPSLFSDCTKHFKTILVPLCHTRKWERAGLALQDLAAAWDDHNLPPDQPPTPRPLPDSDSDSDSGQADSRLSGFGPAELAEYSIPLPGTPMTPAVGPLHKKAGRWLGRKWKKGLLLAAYLGKELREQMAAFRCVVRWALCLSVSVGGCCAVQRPRLCHCCCCPLFDRKHNT